MRCMAGEAVAPSSGANVSLLIRIDRNNMATDELAKPLGLKFLPVSPLVPEGRFCGFSIQMRLVPAKVRPVNQQRSGSTGNTTGAGMVRRATIVAVVIDLCSKNSRALLAPVAIDNLMARIAAGTPYEPERAHVQKLGSRLGREVCGRICER